MSTFTSCQIAYDNMLPSSYYELDEGDYHMEDMSYEDLEDIVNEPPYKEIFTVLIKVFSLAL